MNRYVINGGVTIIYIDSPKYGTKEVLIDTEDLEKLIKFNKTWIFNPSKGQVEYAIAVYRDNEKRRHSINMHRVIIEAPNNVEIDHINKNGLDNRKINLRIVTRKENSQNPNKHRNNKSGYRNVCWDKNHEKWEVKFKKDGKTIHKGRYLLLKDAANAAEKFRKEIFPFSIA